MACDLSIILVIRGQPPSLIFGNSKGTHALGELLSAPLLGHEGPSCCASARHQVIVTSCANEMQLLQVIICINLMPHHRLHNSDH